VFKQGTLTFAPGETVKHVGVKVNGDTRIEPNETLFLVLFDPLNARIADAVGTGLIRNDDSLNDLVDGPFTGSGTIEFSSPRCGGVEIYSAQNYAYSVGEPPDRSGTVDAAGCIDTSQSPFAVRSTFVITNRSGSTLRGVIRGTSTESTFHNTYTVTGGTGIFRNVVGTIEADATYDLDLANNRVENIQGVYAASLHYATTSAFPDLSDQASP
jgi:hypothetical protein